MSTANAVRIAPARGTPSREPHRRPGLQAVPAPVARRRPRLMYGLVAVGGAIAIAAAQLVLSTMTTQGSYQVAKLTGQQRQLTWQTQILSDELAGLDSPQYLAANATALGMVIDESPSYLRLSDAQLLGPGSPAAGASSVDALGSVAVHNQLIAKTPLVTDPAATIAGVPLPSMSGTDPATPAPPAEGLPTPSTH